MWMKCKEEMFKDIADVKESTKFGMIIMKKQAVVWWSWVVGVGTDLCPFCGA